MLAITQQCNNFVAHCCIPNTVNSCASIVMLKASPQYVTFPHSFFNFIVDQGMLLKFLVLTMICGIEISMICKK